MVVIRHHNRASARRVSIRVTSPLERLSFQHQEVLNERAKSQHREILQDIDDQQDAEQDADEERRRFWSNSILPRPSCPIGSSGNRSA
jgi:hypothetical protein